MVLCRIVPWEFFQRRFRFFCWLLQNYAETIQRQARFKIANTEAKEYIREYKKKNSLKPMNVTHAGR